MDDNPKIHSLARRISGLAKAKNLDIDFEAVVTHDISETIDELSNQTNCDWLVMGWNGKAHSGIFVRNPIGWLVTNINSDFDLFKDKVHKIGTLTVHRFCLWLPKLAICSSPKQDSLSTVAVFPQLCKNISPEVQKGNYSQNGKRHWIQRLNPLISVDG